jgi:glycosyltransferase involved in cell wall biosynthesis
MRRDIAQIHPQRSDGADVEAVICIPSYKRPLLLCETLRSLSAQEAPPRFAVVVVDNDAAGREAIAVAEAFFETAPFPSVAAIEPQQGNCHAINAAFALARRSFPQAEFFLMIDDDEAADPSWARRMVEAARAQDADIVGGPVLPRFAAPVRASVARHPVFWPAFQRSGPTDMIYGSGNCLIRARAFAQLDNPAFDVAFNFLGGGDTDFFARCRDAGLRAYWENDARIYETVPQERMTRAWIFRRGLRIGAINRRLDARRYGDALFGRLRLCAKDVAVVGVYALRGLRATLSGAPGLVALHPVVIALGRLLAAFSVETEQYRAPPAAAPMRERALFLTSPSPTPCGVETFARRLAQAWGALGHDAQTLPVRGDARDMVALWRALLGADALILNFPVVAWKTMLLTPLVALLAARALGKDSLLMLHEWDDLDWRRRIVYLAYALFARRIAFSSPMVRAQFNRSALRKTLAGEAAILPIPSNIEPASAPAVPSESAARLRDERALGKTILGHFGSIYPKKHSDFALRIAHELKRRGERVFLVFIGGFVKGLNTVEADFRALLHELDLENDTLVTGYVVDGAEIFEIFDEVDHFVYRFAEGLTSRRGSVLACLQAGGGVIVNAPESAQEFAHHRQYKAALASGALRFVASNASAEEYADALLAAPRIAAAPSPSFYRDGWRDAALALESALQTKRRAARSPSTSRGAETQFG